MLSGVLRAGRASTAERSPLSTPDSILMRYGNFAGCDGVALSGLAAMDYPYFMHFRSDRDMKENTSEGFREVSLP
jgi:hypothetical protein